MVAVGLACGVLSPAVRAAFDLDAVSERARALALQPYRAPAPTANDRLLALNYDDYRDIRFRPEASVWRREGLPFELQFFHLGRGYAACRCESTRCAGGQVRPLDIRARELRLRPNAAPAWPARSAPRLAGFRVHYPLNTAAYKDELVVFLGASYFRALGAGQHYGLSARGLAIDTVGRPERRGVSALHRLLARAAAPDAQRAHRLRAAGIGPRVTGAYRFVVAPGQTTTEVEVQRAPVPARAGGARSASRR